MARKVTDANAAPAASKEAAGADDLSVLMPDGQLTIDGQTITVNEYRFFDGLALRDQARPFFDDLYTLLAPEQHDQPPPSFDDFEIQLLAKHKALVMQMVALSTGQTPEWVAALGDEDGEAVMMTWWQVNSRFFIRRVMRRALQERMSNPSAGVSSTTP